MKRIGLIVIVFVFLSCISVQAGMTIIQYKKAINDNRNKKITTFYVGALGEGLSWANAELKTNERPLLYCQPSGLPITKDGYVAILNNFLKKETEKQMYESFSVGLILLKALQDTFPCPK